MQNSDDNQIEGHLSFHETDSPLVLEWTYGLVDLNASGRIEFDVDRGQWGIASDADWIRTAIGSDFTKAPYSKTLRVAVINLRHRLSMVEEALAKCEKELDDFKQQETVT